MHAYMCWVTGFFKFAINIADQLCDTSDARHHPYLGTKNTIATTVGGRLAIASHQQMHAAGLKRAYKSNSYVKDKASMHDKTCFFPKPFFLIETAMDTSVI